MSKLSKSQRRGATSGRKTTARGGKGKSAAAKARSHAVRSSVGGRALADTGGGGRKMGRTARSDRPRRGPGAVGKEGGRAQSSAGAR
jgi:hypothetical protein